MIFLRQCSIFFASVTIFNFGFVILFATGDPKPEDNWADPDHESSALQALTILNVTNTPWKVMLCFLNSMITIVALTLSLIYSYNNYFKSDSDFISQVEQDLEHQQEALSQNSEAEVRQEDADISTKVFNDIDKAKHSVCL